jgi:predicted Fe-Mo cluster-binding NifX family protein
MAKVWNFIPEKRSSIMRVAIPSDKQDEKVEIYPFFGQANCYFLYEMEKGEFRLLEVRENPASGAIRGLSHAEKWIGVQQIIDAYLNDCDVFVAVNMNKKIVANLVAKGKEVIFVEDGKVEELATRIAIERA